jgi:hypothetical protein
VNRYERHEGRSVAFAPIYLLVLGGKANVPKCDPDHTGVLNSRGNFEFGAMCMVVIRGTETIALLDRVLAVKITPILLYDRGERLQRV